MPKSKVSKRQKLYKQSKEKQKLINKTKTKKIMSKLDQQPVTFVYAKEKETVEVPLKEWLVLNQSANKLQDIAMFVATMEQISRQHIDNQTLLPVFQDDLEPSNEQNPDGSFKMKIKDSFWTNQTKQEVTSEPSNLFKPSIVKVDNEIVYEKPELVDVYNEPIISTDKN